MPNFTKLLEQKYGSIRGAQTKLSEDLNVNQSSVSNWIKGRNFPNPDLIKKMSKLFDISEEEVKKSLDMSEEFTPSVQAVPLTKTNTIQLPILADVPAGLPEFSDRDVEMFVDIPRFMFPYADFVVKCIGDSLEPKIHKGDYCVIRKTQEALDKRAMLVKTENGICMKIINKIGNTIKLCSSNAKYKPFMPSELTIIGLIIGHWSRDDRETW